MTAFVWNSELEKVLPLWGLVTPGLGSLTTHFRRTGVPEGEPTTLYWKPNFISTSAGIVVVACWRRTFATRFVVPVTASGAGSTSVRSSLKMPHSTISTRSICCARASGMPVRTSRKRQNDSNLSISNSSAIQVFPIAQQDGGIWAWPSGHMLHTLHKAELHSWRAELLTAPDLAYKVGVPSVAGAEKAGAACHCRCKVPSGSSPCR